MNTATFYTFTGSFNIENDAPSIMAVAISLCREGRYAGAGLRWFPVGLHSFVVADLLPDRLKFHGLMHDSGECITGDIPSPVKSDENRAFEKFLQTRIYESIGIPEPTEEEHVIIKQADDAALRGEVWAGAGTLALQKVYTRHPEAEGLVLQYMNQYSYADCLDASGLAPIEFLRRYRLYRDMLVG